MNDCDGDEKMGYARRGGVSVLNRWEAENCINIQSPLTTDAAHLTADKTVTVASTTKSVNVGALEHVLLTALGAFIKLEGGNIELCAPGTIEFKAGLKEFAGPKSADAEPTETSKAQVKGCAQATQDASAQQAGAQRL